MARIPEEEVERIKREVSIVRLVESRGVELRRSGASLLGLCPFHEDHEPSLVVSEEKNLWNCLGACQKGGSVIDWVMTADGVPFRRAVEILGGRVPEDHRRVKLAPVVDPAAEGSGLLGQVSDYYHRTLLESPQAQAYLRERGLVHPEIITHFKLGFANRTLGKRIPDANRKAGALLRARLEELGIYRQTGAEHFVGCLVIPVIDEQGRVVQLYGRRIERHAPEGSKHLYLRGPQRGVFNAAALAASKEVILCEALIDGLTFWCAGYRHVTASYGVNGFTEEHLEAFRRHGVRRVYLAYDRDEAGDQAAERLGERLVAQGLECLRVQFPRGMDANDYALKVQPPEQSLGIVLRAAVPMGTGAGPTPATAEPAPPAVEEQQLSFLTAETARTASEPASEAGSEPPASAPSASVRVSPLMPLKLNGDEVVVELGNRRYRVRGFSKALSANALKINLMISAGEAFHVDTLDLYSARARSTFTKDAAAQLRTKEEILQKDLGHLMRSLEDLQEKEIKRALAPEKKVVALSDAEQREAMGLLRDPRLVERILCDFAACGVVGERSNILMGYLAATSRKLDEPLAIIIQSSSAAGKSALMEAMLSFMPAEEQVKYSAMTGQSLFYMGEEDLKHKILAVVEEEGAERASYALKLLQSEGELTIASTGKEPQSGRLVTHTYRVEGPVMILLSTTSIMVDEELSNRCIVLTVNEDQEQTRAIHRQQREAQTIEGLLARQERRHLLKLHQNVQRLLRPVLVANPHARELTFLADRTRTRRDHMKYLTLIRTIALLHQYQRELKTRMHRGQAVRYIEASLEDIEMANRLAHEALGRSLDELPPQTRRMLELLDEMVAANCRSQRIERCDCHFSRRQVREYTGWTENQVRLHLGKLLDMEYLLMHRGVRGQTFVYELLYDGRGQEGRPYLAGLIDVSRLREVVTRPHDDNLVHPEGHLVGGVCPPCGFGSRGLAGAADARESACEAGSEAIWQETPDPTSRTLWGPCETPGSACEAGSEAKSPKSAENSNTPPRAEHDTTPGIVSSSTPEVTSS